MKAVFFDRDGVVNIPPPESEYVLSLDQFEIMPAFPAVLRTVTDLGYVSLVVTNQRCIDKKLVSAETVNLIHKMMFQRLRDEHGISLLDVLYCPHGPTDGCECRKPLPGMLRQAARRHDLDLTCSWMIGDRMTDVEAGRRAGCRTILVNGAPDIIRPDSPYRPDHVCQDMETLKANITAWLA